MEKFTIAIQANKNFTPKSDFGELPPHFIHNIFPAGHHRNLTITGPFATDKFIFQNILELIEDYSDSLSHLEIHNMKDQLRHGCWSFEDILFEAENLTHLTLVSCTLTFYQKLEFLQITNLKSLKLVKTGVKKVLYELLMNCPVLEELTIESWDESQTLDFLCSFPFQLTKLKLDLNSKFVCDDEIATFLLLQLTSLREISLVTCTSGTVVELILNEGNVEKFEVGLSPKIMDLRLEGVKENLKVLSLRGNGINFEIVGRIFVHQNGEKLMIFLIF
jgi:hypothetical protein